MDQTTFNLYNDAVVDYEHEYLDNASSVSSASHQVTANEVIMDELDKEDEKEKMKKDAELLMWLIKKVNKSSPVETMLAGTKVKANRSRAQKRKETIARKRQQEDDEEKDEEEKTSSPASSVEYQLMTNTASPCHYKDGVYTAKYSTVAVTPTCTECVLRLRITSSVCGISSACSGYGNDLGVDLVPYASIGYNKYQHAYQNIKVNISEWAAIEDGYVILVTIRYTAIIPERRSDSSRIGHGRHGASVNTPLFRIHVGLGEPLYVNAIRRPPGDRPSKIKLTSSIKRSTIKKAVVV